MARRTPAAAAARLRRCRRWLSGAAQSQLFLEFRRPRRDLPNDPDCDRHRPGDALLCDDGRRVQFGQSVDHARRQRRLAAALRAHERRELFLHRDIHPHLPRPLFRIVQGAAGASVDARHRHLSPHDGNGLHGLRSALGADELLGRAGHHRILFGYPGDWRSDPRLDPRRLRARPGGAHALLLTALFAALRDCCGGDPAYLGVAHSGIEQPDGHRREGRA